MGYEKPYEQLSREEMKLYEQLEREEQKQILLKRLDDFIQFADATRKYHDLDFYLKLKEYIDEKV